MISVRAAVTAVAFLALAPAALAAQAVNFVERFEETVDDEVENPCNGEIVRITGTISYTTRHNTDASGVKHLSFTRVSNLRGEGESGAGYRVMDNQNLTNHFVNGELYPDHLQTTERIHVISQGKAQNFLVNYVAHYLIEADGNVKFDTQNVSVVCVGKG